MLYLFLGRSGHVLSSQPAVFRRQYIPDHLGVGLHPVRAHDVHAAADDPAAHFADEFDLGQLLRVGHLGHLDLRALASPHHGRHAFLRGAGHQHGQYHIQQRHVAAREPRAGRDLRAVDAGLRLRGIGEPGADRLDEHVPADRQPRDGEPDDPVDPDLRFGAGRPA